MNWKSKSGSGAEVNGCDSNSGVTTSAAKPGDEAVVGMEEVEKVAFGQSGAEPSSSEGAGVILQPAGPPEGLQEGGTPDCSSSDQVNHLKS